MSYRQTIQFLYSLRLFGTKLGLENTRKLAELCGNPQRALRFIHVAGTNGKGSTCAMLERIYRGSGLRVGLFTSPHLVSFRERIQVDREPISEGDVIRLVQALQPALASFDAARHPTFFEVVAVLALLYFAERGCELVVWETGLGGRLDATNIVTPLASVITNVQLDHEKWLGSTLTEIASEKAGIIKPGIPVVTAAGAPEALQVIASTAERNGCVLVQVTHSDLDQWPVKDLRLPLLGEHQRLNAALALATVRLLTSQIPISLEAGRAALEQVQWPGRLQQLRTPDGRLIVLDGAHNPAGAESLRDALQPYFPGKALTLVLGIMQDKDWTAMCAVLAPLARRVLLARVHSERTARPKELEQVCLASNPNLETGLCDSLEEALELAKHDPLVVITGSLHFVGEAMELLHLLPASPGERGLNEWDASGTPRVAVTAASQ